MSIAGHISKRMVEHYSHTRMDAKRKALEALSAANPAAQAAQFEGGYGTNHGRNGHFQEATKQ